jgi:hypothetical protein
MFTFDRRVVCGSALSALGPCLLLGLLIGVPDLAVHAWSVPCLKGVWPEEQSREARITQRLEAVRSRVKAKQAIARDVVDGRLTLLEGAARCRDIDRRSPEFRWTEFRESRAASCDEERHCQEIIEQVDGVLPWNSPQKEEILHRLRAELRQHLEYGLLQLPDPEV